MDSKLIRQYLRVIIRWWWLFVVSAAIPMAISFHFASQQPDLYQATATIMVGTGLQNPDPDPYQLRLSNTLAAAYAELVRQGPIVESVVERLGLEIPAAQLATQIGTNIYSGAQLLEIWVTNTNPEAAALIANALADELIRRSPASGQSDPEQQQFIRRQMEELQQKIGDVSGQIDELAASLPELTSAAELQEAQDRITALEQVKSTYQTTYAELLAHYSAESPNVLSMFEPAVVPQWPIPSKTILIVAVAGVAGLGLVLGAIFLMEYLDTSLQWRGDGEHTVLNLQVLGTVPQVSRKDALISGNSLNPIAGGIRALRSNLYLMRPGEPFRSLLLTSPNASDGKSLIVANLAIVLASAGNRVIVVDGDMRRSKQHELFDRPNVKGLADLLSEYMDEGLDPFSILLQETGYDNLYLLSAGRPPADPAALLTSVRFPELLELLKEGGDVVLIDSPPVLGPPDATVLATQADGTILVGSVGATRRESIQQARDRLLAQDGVNLLGIAVNRAKLDSSYSYYGSDRDDKATEMEKADGDDVLLTLGEAAARLGISKDQARRWCKSGRLPAVRKALLWWRIDPNEVKRMLEDTWEIRAKL